MTTERHRLRFACQTYSWQMSIDRYRGRIDHMTEVAGRAGFDGFEAELVMLGDSWTVDDIETALDRAGLRPAALVLAEPWLEEGEREDERDRADLLIRTLRTLGDEAKLVLVPLPGADRRDLLQRQRTALTCMGAITRRAARAGVEATFHPNSPAGSVFRTEADYRVMHDLWPDGLRYTPDVGHIAKGGMDPIEVLEEHWDLIDHVHIKDLDASGAWAPTGRGAIDIPRVLRLLEARAFAGWVTLEEESEQARIDPDAATLENGAWLQAWKDRR
ncbi:sugar phosphate isomerase/epimerase family protein [uncultured Amnibacterium sp.]|uniref:sugar phosphate isomerase/epimerase family protein n=1 Tax=uncultured Amnibacterium sp. TaxID=1631851 RepID=UPI0035CB0E6D